MDILEVHVYKHHIYNVDITNMWISLSSRYHILVNITYIWISYGHKHVTSRQCHLQCHGQFLTHLFLESLRKGDSVIHVL